MLRLCHGIHCGYRAWAIATVFAFLSFQNAYAVLVGDVEIQNGPAAPFDEQFVVLADNHLLFTGSSPSRVNDVFGILTGNFGNAGDNNGDLSVPPDGVDNDDLGVWAAQLGTMVVADPGTVIPSSATGTLTQYENLTTKNTYLYIAAWSDSVATDGFLFSAYINSFPVASDNNVNVWEYCSTGIDAFDGNDTRADIVEVIDGALETCTFGLTPSAVTPQPNIPNEWTGFSNATWIWEPTPTAGNLVLFRYNLEPRVSEMVMGMTTQELTCDEATLRFGITCTPDQQFVEVTIDPPLVDRLQMTLEFDDKRLAPVPIEMPVATLNVVGVEPVNVTGVDELSNFLIVRAEVPDLPFAERFISRQYYRALFEDTRPNLTLPAFLELSAKPAGEGREADFVDVFLGTTGEIVRFTPEQITKVTLGTRVQSIGVHFPSDRDAAAGLAPHESAGIPGAQQTNWNYADGGGDAQANASGSTETIVSPNAGSLTLSDGTPTSATVEWTSNGTWNTTNGTATGDAKLMNGYIDAIGADDPFSMVSFNDLPFVGEYNAIVYFGSDGNGRTGQVTDGTTTYSFSTFSNDPDGSGGFDASDYVMTMDTGEGFPEANYAVFEGLTGSSWSVEIVRGSNNSGIHGVQLSGVVPEPATLSMLLGIAAFGFGFVRRCC